MEKSVSYEMGRLVAKVPPVVWVWLLMIPVLVLFFTWQRSPEVPQAQALTKAVAGPDPVVVKCQAERADKVAQYPELMKSDPWKAANSIRVCAKRLEDKELQAMLAAAERADLEKTLLNPNASPNERLQALERLTDLGDPVTQSRAVLKANLIKKVAQNEAALAKAARARKKSEGVSLGASAQDVLDSNWGKPERINRSQNASGTREQWVYGDGNYLYFRNGVLDSVQTSH